MDALMTEDDHPPRVVLAPVVPEVVHLTTPHRLTTHRAVATRCSTARMGQTTYVEEPRLRFRALFWGTY